MIDKPPFGNSGATANGPTPQTSNAGPGVISGLSATEKPHAEHQDLDQYSATQLIEALAADQLLAVAAVQKAAKSLAHAVEASVPKVLAGGRLIYVGAGTSGRLGLLDSVELPPTFSWPGERAVALLAGGNKAMFEAVEGAEDNAAQGAADIAQANVGPLDVVLLLAASGSTPYVAGALGEARERGALTIGFANNPNAPITQNAHIGITLDTGSEIISGSTRLKAGTSQKIALNSFSSALMIKLGKVYRNLMVDVKATNIKLRRRCVNLTVLATGATPAAASAALDQCDNSVKTAIVMLQRHVTASQARQLLDQVGGHLRLALDADLRHD